MSDFRSAFAEEFSSRAELPIISRLALSMHRAWASAPLEVSLAAGDRLVGGSLPDAQAGYSFGGGVYFDRGTNDPDLQSLAEAFSGYITGEEIGRLYTPEERAASGDNVYWAGGWGGHVVLNYERLLARGTDGIRDQIQRARQVPPPEGAQSPAARALFHSAMEVVCDTVDVVAARYALALRAAGRHDIAAVLERVPKAPCESWEEAAQAFWLIFTMDGVDSPGRLDQYMWPYYKKAIDEGRHGEAKLLLREMWLKFEEVRAWNVCVGGVRADGTDASNQLSHDILDLAAEYRHVAPNLTMRVHPGTPREMWTKAMAAIATGIGMPALYNDDIVIPALVRHGIGLEDARDYCMNGCNQIDIQGRSHMGLEDGEISLIKCLELALHDGADPRSGVQLGPHTGDARTFGGITDVVAALKTQVSFFVGEIVRVSNRSQEVYSRTAPGPLRSLLVDGCIEKGLDVKSGGAVYNHGQVLIQGIGNTADSIAAIDALVFKGCTLSMAGLLQALDDNWEGHEADRVRALRAPKFGNDSDDVDGFAADVVDHVLGELKKHQTFRGGTYGGGSSVFVRGIGFGRHVGATPDGRKAGTPLADSVGPVQGRDRNGPTAMLSSAAKPDLTQAVSGYVLNLRLSKEVLDAAGCDRVIALIQAYFAKGGQQVQIAVLSGDELRLAQEEPEKHGGLIVRVGGFSEYFVSLDRDLQDEIISRTEHTA